MVVLVYVCILLTYALIYSGYVIMSMVVELPDTMPRGKQDRM
jgi:hypothetical protein